MSRNLLLILCLLGISWLASSQPADLLISESQRDKDIRMQWWREARFGMFIHWGLYAVPAGEYNGKNNYGEWIMTEANIPVREYEKFAGQFNPQQFNAEEWVKMAKDAGMKYIVITSKHHDGFSMFGSKVSDYNLVYSTPYGRDVMKDLADACRKYGLSLCFYHSIMDWHHPLAKGSTFPEYREKYLKQQLKELLSNYGDIGVLWFDGEWIDEWTEEQGRDLYNYVRSLQPKIIINNRVGKGRNGMQGMNTFANAAGDFGTPEQEILDTHSAQDWESCMTMNDHWGFNKKDKNFKSTADLVWNLADCAAKGGNYLLNVGPKADGTFPEESVERLRGIGDWMQVNAEAIYGSKAWKYDNDGENVRYTCDGKGIVYAIVRGIHDDRVRLKKVLPLTKTVTLLGCPEKLTWIQDEDGIVINLVGQQENIPGSSPAGICVFKIRGKPLEVAAMPVIGSENDRKNGKVIFLNTASIAISSQPGTEIHYTIDGSDPVRTSPVYMSPVTMDQSCTVKAVAFASGKVSSEVQSLEFRKANASVTLLTETSPKYPGLGPLTLVDGLKAPLKFTDPGWLGYQAEDFSAIVDLGSIRQLKTVNLSCLENINSWIFRPLSVEIYTSTDGLNFAPSGARHLEPASADIPAQSLDITVPVSASARYVKVTAKNTGICPAWHPGYPGKAWLFIDEITIEN